MDFTALLNSITPNDIQILTYYSMNYEYLNGHDLFTFFTKLSLKDENGKAFGSATASAKISYFEKKGIFIKTTNPSLVKFKSDTFKAYLIKKASDEAWFPSICQTIKTTFPINEGGWQYQQRHILRSLRDYRLAIYGLNNDYLVNRLDPEEERYYNYHNQLIATIFPESLSLEDLRLFAKPFQERVINLLISHDLTSGNSISSYLVFIKEQELFKGTKGCYFECTDLFFKGEFEKIKENIANETDTSPSLQSLLGLVLTIEGSYQEAIQCYENALKIWKKATNKKKGYFTEWSLIGYGLALFKVKESSFHSFFKEYEKYGEKYFSTQDYIHLLGALYYFSLNDISRSLHYLKLWDWNSLFQQFWYVIISPSISKAPYSELILPILAKTTQTEYRLLEREILYYLSLKSIKQFDTTKKNRLEALNLELGTRPFGELIPVVDDWQRSLNLLISLGETLEGKTAKGINDNEPTSRLAWQLDFATKNIQPVEQKRNKSGWSAGRNVALKRLAAREYDYLSAQDAKAISVGLIEETYNSGWYSSSSSEYYFDWDKTILALADHPHLFSTGFNSIPLSLTKGEVALQVSQKKDNVSISFDFDFHSTGVQVIKETATRYKVIEITPLHLQILKSFDGKSLKVPASSKDALLKALNPLAKKIAVLSDLDEEIENLPSVEADTRIYALLNPLNDGFHLEFFVKPFAEFPPYIKPGKGAEKLLGTHNDQRIQTKRNLKKERTLLNDVEAMCPTLAAEESDNYEWVLNTPEDCLQALLEIDKPKQEGKLVIEWPKGQKLKLMGTITSENFSMKVNSENNWFDVSGEAKIDTDLVMSLKEILQKMNSTSNFIQLSDGQFVAITEKLRKHLTALNAVLDDKMKGNILAAGMLEELSEEVVNFKANKAWKERIKRLKDLRTEKVALPSTFEAELRPYQEDGYQWLSQLANWGVGACLADDMGLGKTVQALALLLQRATLGPALVVAPVSVCRNWEKEARRFAPTLNLTIFGGTGRKDILQQAGAFDVIIVSYGLLQTEEAIFTDKKFATILLDEAQAIKNKATKRSKTVMALDGDFKIITTGTPVENHLGELWNLFNFINPGLLGSHERFQERFAIPIEKNQDLEKRKTLQKLIKPFILRRRKNQVLDELPAKTEIVLNVEMSVEERSFYESVRLDALERIESDNENAPDKRFRILAELTRLRLACCHPKLVNPELPLSSSKLELFGEIMEELIDNKHKALVFSQFTKHLAIIENYLISKNISYQYLDGSTPPQKRQERIDAFQRGQGDVFLISLKAGGTGLNLTAADYVIHLDPWWNPAVEDQATDRAHRMGQQRPVTVYRLVTENTVESKILKLHETKRDLADGLLEGSEGSGKMSAEELMALIREI